MLGRLPTETVSVEELDPLQTDLEVLLASVGRRLKLLESEIQVLHNWQDKKDVKTPILKGKVVCMTMSTSFFLTHGSQKCRNRMVVFWESFFSSLLQTLKKNIWADRNLAGSVGSLAKEFNQFEGHASYLSLVLAFFCKWTNSVSSFMLWLFVD